MSTSILRPSVPSPGTQLTDLDKLQLLETEPAAGRLAAAVAGYPYNIRTAVLDIADNAVENGATRMSILLNETGVLEDVIVIADNGTGIAPEILNEVLRAGSDTSARYSKNSLSRYGIGLKGAAFSLGERVTVLTKHGSEQMQRRALDLATITKYDKWLQEVRAPNPQEKAYFTWAMEQLPGETNEVDSGTVIIVEKLNLRSKDRDRTKVLRDIIRACGETYARFLSTNLPEGNRVSMNVDATPITPVDPLHRENSKTAVFYDRQEIKLSDGTVLFFSAVALPHPKQLEAELDRHYRYTQDNQGVYIYRNNRLIASGQLLGLFSRDFHLNAFRAELVYGTDADHHVVVDVAKSTVMLSQEATSKLQEFVNNCIKTADVLWRERDVVTPEDIKGLFDESNRLIASRIKLLAKRRVTPKTGKVKTGKAPEPGAPVSKHPVTEEGAYLVPVETLPDGVLYRPIWNGDSESVVVEVNLSHPFSKAVFAVTPDEAKKKVPRKATSAVQQLLYILGSTEYTFDDQEARQLFEQFRKHASLNLNGLLVGL